ncbi:MAG: RNA 2',3'-cyclic phosphodiesterase [Candidatus Pacebacteria bacterium]|nr:RNA 2',3'-cyclic phosphodiesterase [Candidatus Paceibacterota bacterium]
MEKTKRLFIAINLPMELKRELFEIQKEINSQFPEEYAQSGLFKFVEMENLHLTLKFIGEAKESQIPKIIENIENITKNQKSFEIKTAKICYDNENENQCPRLIWLTTAKNRELENLSRALGSEKKYSGHITLARIKEWVFKQIEPSERPQVNRELETIIPVNSIELMESVLKKTGPEYKIIKSFNLRN